jgi:EmrB/QacA subfamily drug resistance transporter
MKGPCDEAVIRSGKLGVPCRDGRWVLAATILGSSMAFIDSTVVNVALPAIQANLGATVVGLQWVVEAYGLFLASLILAGGSLGDTLGRRKVFLAGVVVFAAASMACGFSSTIRQLIIARSVQGLGAALLVPGSLAIIGAAFDEQRRGAAIGTWSGFTAITTAIGPVLGGWFVEHASWRWAFFINLPLAIAVIFISLWHVPESQSRSVRRLDWVGTLLATLGCSGIVAGFVESGALGWKHPFVIFSLFAGSACLVVFVIWESHTSSPMVPLDLFTSSTFSAANLLTLLLYAALGFFFFVFPLNLIQVQGYSAVETGAATLPFIVLMFALSRWSGGLAQRYGPRLPLIVGPLMCAAGFAMFAVPSSGGSYWKSFFPAIVVLGFGMAATVAPLTTVVMNAAGESRVGAASGINNAVARLAGVLAIAVLGTVMVRVFGSHLDQRITTLHLPPDVLHVIQAEKIKLAGLELPPNLDTDTRATIMKVVRDAFVFGFRLLMLICAALSAAGAIATASSLRDYGHSVLSGAQRT